MKKQIKKITGYFKEPNVYSREHRQKLSLEMEKLIKDSGFRYSHREIAEPGKTDRNVWTNGTNTIWDNGFSIEIDHQPVQLIYGFRKKPLHKSEFLSYIKDNGKKFKIVYI